MCKNSVALESCCDDRFFLSIKMQIWSNFPQCDPVSKPAISVRWKRHFIVCDCIYLFVCLWHSKSSVTMKIRLQNQSSIEKTTEVKCRDGMERTRKNVYGTRDSSRLNHHSLNDTDLRDVFNWQRRNFTTNGTSISKCR